MIINIYTLVMLFLAFVSIVLGGFLFYSTIKALLVSENDNSLETKSLYERKGYLIFLVACVVLSVRMLVWPWFYLMLQSFVTEIPGAMCMFGVTQILPDMMTFLQIIKPVSFFIMGGWLLCYCVDKSTPTAPLAKKNLFFLVFICIILLVDSFTDAYYVLRMKPLMSVSCCATFFDVPLRPSAMIPQSMFGKHFQTILFILYFLINVVLILLLSVSLSKKWFLKRKKKILYSQIVLAFFNIPIVLFAVIEVIAPKLMQLPFHHCIYCFLGNGTVPDAPFIMGLFAIGTFAIGWMAILRFLCNHEETQSAMESLSIKVNNMAVFCLLGSVVMVIIHLVFI